MAINSIIIVGAGASNTSLAAGSVVTPRGSNLGATVVTNLHGRLYESNYRGNVFTVASQALATTTVGLATTYTGMVLSNPITSTVNLVLEKCSIMQSVIQATQVEAYALAVGFNASTNVTHTTPATIQSAKIGSSFISQAKADTAATLPTAPVYHTFLMNTATSTQNSIGGIDDIDGAIILPPGAYVLYATPTQASVASLWLSFTWSEVPV